MRVKCRHCNNIAKITHSREISPLVIEYYCLCLAKNCKTKFKACLFIGEIIDKQKNSSNLAKNNEVNPANNY